jgi:uncharacterized protein YbjT (DUF2867 family)
MLIRNILVLGGSGFLGRHVAHQLAERGLQVRVPTRNRERAKQLILLPSVDVVTANVHDPATLDRLVGAADAVVNLIGILHGDFQRIHVELPRQIIEACRRHGVRRLVHVSSLQADPTAPSMYLRSKGEAEQLVLAAQGDDLQTTIMRPSVIFGREDHFLNLFARLARRLPVIALASPDARFQPVHVNDVARTIVACLREAHTFGQRYDLCGPRVYTLRQLVEYVVRAAGLRRPIIGLGPAASMLQAAVLEHLPGRLMTRDNIRSMRVDSVCRSDTPAVFGFTPTPLEAVAPLYLAGTTPRARYNWFRFRARR